ncbi:Membrane permease (sugar transporter) [Propionibacterium freudenreichii]|uniref:MFS transporter n=1 Tax=Propionibacterium freudenreichii TaxID=1744 RepID=UPI0005A5C574|nr:MFS transporter [Propionibacterium freudenreichii]CEI28899.1 Membrane permease (sugar transporter) [Propionibacterium freudenreichii]
MSQPVSAPAVNEKDLIRKITLRIVPFVMVLYTIAYVDRSVIGFAKLHMAADIGLSDTAYGLGAGLFFLGYFLFEVPSNYVMPRFGARKWFTRILVTWGLVTMATALVPNATTFYIVRFLLGMAEAGFYPGILYYLTLWYPQRHRTKATGTFVLAAPLAFLIMSPLAGWMLGLDWFSLQGWHWMFLLCGGIAVIAAIPTLLLLHDTPEDAPWMSKAEVAWIEAELAKDKATLGQVEHKNPLAAMKSKYVWVFALLFFPSTVGVYGLSFWVPTVVHRFSGSDVATGWLSAIPYIFGLVGILITSRWASRFKENWIPLAVIFAGAAVGIGMAGVLSSPLGQMASMSVAAFCLYSIAGVFWPLPTRYLVGGSAAVGIAFMNSFGNIGGFVGPYVVGAISDATGAATNGMYFLSGVLFLGAIFTLVVRKFWEGRNPEPLVLGSKGPMAEAA